MKRFNQEARKDLAAIDPQTTLGEYLLSNIYSNEFIQHYIIYFSILHNPNKQLL